MSLSWDPFYHSKNELWHSRLCIQKLTTYRANAVPTPQPPREMTQDMRARSGRPESVQRQLKTRPAAPPIPATASAPASQRKKMSSGRAARPWTTSHRPPACGRSKRAMRVSGGAGRAGSVRGVRGVVWYDNRRVSAFEGPAAHPLLRCTATVCDIGGAAGGGRGRLSRRSGVVGGPCGTC